MSGYKFTKAQIQSKFRKLKASYLAVKDNNGKTGQCLTEIMPAMSALVPAAVTMLPATLAMILVNGLINNYCL